VQSGDPDGRHVLAQAAPSLSITAPPITGAARFSPPAMRALGIRLRLPVFIQMLEDALEAIEPPTTALCVPAFSAGRSRVFQARHRARPADLTY